MDKKFEFILINYIIYHNAIKHVKENALMNLTKVQKKIFLMIKIN